ncbi:MAG: hypothetical protein JWO36_6039 [Myxococcales bacterium]|nr:hypothetical protein [Myxococcales bacterium]
MRAIRTLVGATAVLAATTIAAHAFCGFYVAGSNQKMFNDATQVVLMRDGTRTVLAMQNDYRGPLEDFAMVVPVPVVLKESDVRVLDKAVFDRLDSLGSPRLVEYWEQDPCPPPPREEEEPRPMRMKMSSRKMEMPAPSMSASGGARSMDDEDAAPPRKAIAPVLASFTANPMTLTAGAATQVTFGFRYSNQPWPDPSCNVDHNVGAVYDGAATSVTLQESTKLTLTCANSAGKSQKEIKINVVKIEAQFDVAEYQIVILSATEAAGLQDWLKLNGYKIPEGAEPLLRPYIESGSKFFVAKVDPKKVKMIDGHAALSPLRFHYDTEDFSLPIRLGLANSSGKQDLIVNILSADKRYEVANYKNVFVPTNFDVKASVKSRFGEFYNSVFDKTIEANPGAVVTEYAWTARPRYHCDPCTDADITNPDLMTLGADITGGQLAKGNFVLTRLHARYGKKDMKDDLRFREAKPVTGGREQWGKSGIEYGAVPSAQNYFQARYAIRYWWQGAIKCSAPQRGVWGGPPNGGRGIAIAAGKTAFAPRGKLDLASVINRDLWEIGYKKQQPKAPAPPPPPPKPTTKTMGLLFGGSGLGALLLVGVAILLVHRRRALRTSV